MDVDIWTVGLTFFLFLKLLHQLWQLLIMHIALLLL